MMKIYKLRYFLCLLLILSSMGCVACANEESKESAVIYEKLSEFLNDEQIEIYKLAQNIYPLFVGFPDSINTLHLKLAGADTQTILEFLVNNDYPQNSLNINGLTYHMCIGEYQKLSDLKELCLSVFTPDYFEKLNDTGWGIPTFVEIDQHLYYAFTSRGSAFGYNPQEYPDKYELIKKNENEIIFNVIGHYKSSNVDPDYTVETRSFPVSMVLTDNGWRFSEFSSAMLS